MKRPSFSGTVGKKWWSWHLLSFWMQGGIGITIAESVLNGAAPYHDASVVVWIDAWGQGLEISGTNWPRSSNNDGVSWSSTCNVWKSSAVTIRKKTFYFTKDMYKLLFFYFLATIFFACHLHINYFYYFYFYKIF